jgi:tetratricopeptide (TPR) repeat protein
MRCLEGCALAFLAVACTTTPRPEVGGDSADSINTLVEAVLTDARRSEREADPRVRDQLVLDATRKVDVCLAREPQAAACLYGRALAVGLRAQAHPAHVGELLDNMLTDLKSAENLDPNYDHGGPARVRALVLVRTPGWPLGPGDPDAGLAAARRAVSLSPQYPPNRLALAEALAKSGDTKAAREEYQRARDVIVALPSSTDRDEWLREADQALPR